MAEIQQITSPEQRTRFVGRGWQPFERMNGRTAEFFVKGEWVAGIWRDEGPVVTSGKDGRPAPMSVWLEVASILGISPPGYRLVPEERMRRLETALQQIADDCVESTPSEYMSHTYDECDSCSRKVDIARAALSPDKKEEAKE